MGSKYTTTSVTGYNSSPPADDGSAVGSNQVKWNTVKTKVGDPLNTFAGSIDTKLVTALDLSMSTSAVTYTTTAADHLKPVRITAAATVHLGDAATMAVGYQTGVVNAYTAAITVDLATAGNKLNTVVGGSISLQPGNAVIVAVNQAGDGYDIIGHSFFDDTTPAPKIAGATVNFNAEASIASAATVNIGAATSNNILITGTTTITAFDTVAAGITRTVRFNGALTLTYNASSLILPGKVSITTAANDCAEFESLGSGNWICRNYTRADGTAINSGMKWLETQNPSASTTITFATTLLPARRYRLVGRTTVSASDSMAVRFNADSGANYGVVVNTTDSVVPGNTPASSSGSTQILVNTAYAGGDLINFDLEFETQQGDSTGVIVTFNSSTIRATRAAFNRSAGSGFYKGAGALSSLTVFNYNAAGTYTGILRLYIYNE